METRPNKYITHQEKSLSDAILKSQSSELTIQSRHHLAEAKSATTEGVKIPREGTAQIRGKCESQASPQ